MDNIKEHRRIGKGDFERALKLVLQYQNQCINDAKDLNKIPKIAPYDANINTWNFDLSVRCLNALRGGGLVKMGEIFDIMTNNPKYLMKLPNFGKKSYMELIELMRNTIIG